MGARLVLRQETAALTLKQEGGPGEKLLPCWPWGETTYPAPGLVPCSDLGSAAGGRGLRRGVGAALQHDECSGLWGLQEDGEQVPDAVAGQLKHLTRVRPRLKNVGLCSFCEAFSLQSTGGAVGVGHGKPGELVSGMSPSSSPPWGWVRSGHQ